MQRSSAPARADPISGVDEERSFPNEGISSRACRSCGDIDSGVLMEN